MKILVVGHKGMIGRELVRRGAEPLDVDVTDFTAVKESLIPYQGKPYTIINCAVKKNVDFIEDFSDSYQEAHRVNINGVQNLAESLTGTGSLIHLSSCHVFSGKAYYPYAEYHKPSPVNLYGWTKFLSESALSLYTARSLVVRLGKVYSEKDLADIANLPDDYKVPKFLKRSFTHISNVSRILMDLTLKIRTEDFPGKFYPVLHVGGDQNYNYDLFYNLVRQKYGKSILQRRGPINDGSYAPRPYRCALNVKKMKKMFPDYRFRSV